MNHTRGLRCAHADRDGPGPRLLRPGREVGLQAQQRVSFVDHAVQARLFEAQGLEELGPLGRIEQRDLAFDLGGDDHRLGVVASGAFEDLGGEGVAGARRVLIDIADVQSRLGREQLEHAPGFLVVFGDLGRTRGTSGVELFEGQVRQPKRRYAFLIAALGPLLQVDDAFLEALQVGQHQLGLDDVEIGEWVDPAFDVGDVGVLEAAGDEGHGVTVADRGQELVAQALALGRAAH